MDAELQARLVLVDQDPVGTEDRNLGSERTVVLRGAQLGGPAGLGSTGPRSRGLQDPGGVLRPRDGPGGPLVSH